MGVTAVNNVPDIVIKSPSGAGTGENKNVAKPAVKPVAPAVENVAQEKYNEDAVRKIIEQANRLLAPHNTQLSFTIHEATREVLVKVLDSDSGEVLKEIPSQKTLDRLAAVLEDIGWIIDRKV